MFNYHLTIGLKENIETIPESVRKLAGKYEALMISNSKPGAYSLIFETSDDLTKQNLEQVLGNIPLINFEKIDCKKLAKIN